MEEVIKDISADRVDEIEESYKDEGCTTERKLQSNGLFTIIAHCPDE